MALRYLLELHTRKGSGLELARAVALPPTATLTLPHQHATGIGFTLGDLPIREHTANRFVLIQLSGVSGLAPRTGSARDGGATTASGPALMREFRTFLDEYQTLAAQQGAQYLLAGGDGVRRLRQGAALVFRALDDDVNVYVEPETLELGRDPDNRLTYRWTLVLKAYGRVAPKEAAGPIEGADSAKAARDASGKAAAAVAKLDAWLAAGRDRIASANGLVLAARRPLLALGRASSTLQALVTDARRLATAPVAALADVYYAARSVRAALFDLVTAAPTAGIAALTELRRLRGLLLDVEEAERATLAALGLAGGRRGDLATAAETTPLFPATQAKVFPPATPHPATAPYKAAAGENLATIAAKILGDAKQWPALAEINGFLGFGTKGDGSPLLPGDVVLVPAASAGLSPVSAADPYGVDLWIDPATGDLGGVSQLVVYNDPVTGAPVATVPEVVDLRLSTGESNALQGLRLRLLTPQGEWRLRPGFGIAPQIGAPLLAAVRGQTAAQAAEQLRADKRVQRVRSLDVQDTGSGLVVEAEIDLIASGALTVLATVPAT